MIEKIDAPAIEARLFERSSRGIGSYEIHVQTKPSRN
jgi:hypothetical protein